MGKLWDFLMRRKPLCLGFFLVFGLSVALSRQVLLRVIQDSPLSTTPETTTPVTSPPPISSDTPTSPGAPSDLVVPPTSDSTSDDEAPSGDNSSEIISQPIADPTLQEPDQPAPGPLDGDAEATPPEVATPTPTEDYLVVVTSPSELALLSPIDVPHTGGEPGDTNSAQSYFNFGGGNNLSTDHTPESDPTSAVISSDILANGFNEKTSSSSFFATFITIGVIFAAFAFAYSLLAHFLR